MDQHVCATPQESTSDDTDSDSQEGSPSKKARSSDDQQVLYNDVHKIYLPHSSISKCKLTNNIYFGPWSKHKRTAFK